MLTSWRVRRGAWRESGGGSRCWRRRRNSPHHSRKPHLAVMRRLQRRLSLGWNIKLSHAIRRYEPLHRWYLSDLLSFTRHSVSNSGRSWGNEMCGSHARRVVRDAAFLGLPRGDTLLRPWWKCHRGLILDWHRRGVEHTSSAPRRATRPCWVTTLRDREGGARTKRFHLSLYTAAVAEDESGCSAHLALSPASLESKFPSVTLPYCDQVTYARRGPRRSACWPQARPSGPACQVTRYWQCHFPASMTESEE